MMVFDNKQIYGIKVLPTIKGLQKYSCTEPGKGNHKLFQESYGLIEKNKKGQIVWGKEWFKTRQFIKPTGWQVTVPIRPRALVRAGDVVFIAGPEDAYPAKSAALYAYAAADGKKLSVKTLPAEPVFDGMIAARGRLFVSCEDGKVRCFGKK